ncbi:MAG: hypothetical protein KUG76_08125 [Gammaproteobacteria bacterium]|nr:hypothetical protein [Gammaproteobacteria bacterium]
MKKIVVLLGTCFFLPACTMDLAGATDDPSGISLGGTTLNLDTGLDTSFGIGDDDGPIGTIGDGQWELFDGKLF